MNEICLHCQWLYFSFLSFRQFESQLKVTKLCKIKIVQETLFLKRMHFKKKAEKCQWQRAQSDQRYSTCQKDKAGPAYSVSSKWSKMAKNLAKDLAKNLVKNLWDLHKDSISSAKQDYTMILSLHWLVFIESRYVNSF